jgi:putative ABC transport system ATP-binding protein
MTEDPLTLTLDTGVGMPLITLPAVPVLEMVGIERTFPGDPPVEVLKGLDLIVMAGDYVAIVGPSGSGKSTLLNLIGLLDRPTGGTYAIDGVETSTLGEGDRAGVRGSKIGFVFQSFHLLSHRSALENVMLAELYNRRPRAGRVDRARAALTRVGLEHRVDFEPTRMSGGERQRVAIARALVSEPSLLLCDEPTGNLDSANTESVLELFDDLRREGLTLLTITHDYVVSERAGRVITMRDGRFEDT